MSQLPRRLLVALVKGYRLVLSPWLGNACRFEPTCSAYAIDALTLHGATVGSALAAARIARCHPWCRGGLDPVPARPFAPFSSLLKRPSPTAPAAGASDRPCP